MEGSDAGFGIGFHSTYEKPQSKNENYSSNAPEEKILRKLDQIHNTEKELLEEAKSIRMILSNIASDASRIERHTGITTRLVH